MTSPKKRRGQGDGDPKTMAKIPKPHYRSRAASPPSLLVSTPPTPTSPPLIQTPRRSVPNHQTHLQMCPVFRRTSAGSANNIHSTLKSTFSSLVAERDRLRHTIDLQGPQPAQVMGLKTTYASECKGGSPLVHQVSNESKASIPESISEFFDAQEYLLSSSSSEVSDDDSYISDVISNVLTLARRRSTLPSPSPDSGVSLWNILRNNIGKDLSKVAMPVHLNEPINTLQRLCEELEYSELLDTANQTQDPYQRMVYVATFAISAYASSYYRAGSKPFNPVLGETYECDRPDKNFKFIAEQVSHHPPVSACHC
ncbi:Oxysterol-binding protein-related protein 3 [Larimichthys crocea]|uniref:Uncharacterized protein n=1 Tax=Larimichthys crocea TaxID=215358 RepID=A0ACD3RGP5_LARCR|nr:Oxysterol-binding protein-related protein 3 [Larimichthys crocea]